MPVLHSLLDAFTHPRTTDPASPSLTMPRRLSVPVGYGDFGLRPVELDDADEWNAVRWGNKEWLAPWESGDPLGGSPLTFNEWVASLRRNETAGSSAVFVMEFQTAIVGQISLGAICYGAMRTATVGYWVDKDHVGHGFAPLAVALLADWAFFDPSGPRLHRIEIDVLPSNQRSLRVAQKLGMNQEGIKRGYMFIGGQWRDHLSFSLLANECQEGVLKEFLEKNRDTPRIT
ncbi:acetyltransferase [Bombiscardovia apis]|uniref:Acetyltransferase n=1 Tax=Bombiscardovia apis TaxID=2932182 RepID=A0ABM8BE61_9BIFI|nr:GNAT family protein [Bombiscardovia apis]BDR55183.1 acetyltransferase [Bombiscardovia apis]